MRKIAYGMVILLGMLSFTAFAQKNAAVQPDLQKLIADKKIKVVNRTVSASAEKDKKAIHLDGKPGDGIAWLTDIKFNQGILEFDVRGEDKFQQSFLGIAFHGADDKIYDAIYFRPFNFKSQDSIRRIHAVQYISHPVHTWQKLRNEQPGKYEKAVQPAPDPNGWFHVKVVVQSPKVSVYVNNNAKPSLEVEQLESPRGEMLGFWVGNTSAGDFANLKIIPSKQSKP